MPFDVMAGWKLLSGALKIIERINDGALREELRGEIDRLNQHFSTGMESLQSEAREQRERAERAEQDRDTLREQNRKLRDEAAERVDLLQFKRARNCYRKDGLAYCVACLESRRQACSLVHNIGYSTVGVCPTCKAEYADVFTAGSLNLPSISRDDRFKGW